jgi:hypothetical protein
MRKAPSRHDDTDDAIYNCIVFSPSMLGGNPIYHDMEKRNLTTIMRGIKSVYLLLSWKNYEIDESGDGALEGYHAGIFVE